MTFAKALDLYRRLAKWFEEHKNEHRLTLFRDGDIREDFWEGMGGQRFYRSQVQRQLARLERKASRRIANAELEKNEVCPPGDAPSHEEVSSSPLLTVLDEAANFSPDLWGDIIAHFDPAKPGSEGTSVTINLGKHLSVHLVPGKGGRFTIKTKAGETIDARATEKAMGALRLALLQTGYLPMHCPGCGRYRLEFVGADICCDSCGRNHTQLPIEVAK